MLPSKLPEIWHCHRHIETVTQSISLTLRLTFLGKTSPYIWITTVCNEMQACTLAQLKCDGYDCLCDVPYQEFHYDLWYTDKLDLIKKLRLYCDVRIDVITDAWTPNLCFQLNCSFSLVVSILRCLINEHFPDEIVIGKIVFEIYMVNQITALGLISHMCLSYLSKCSDY